MPTKPPDDVPVETHAADTPLVVETAMPTEPSDSEDDVPKDTAAADTLTVVETSMTRGLFWVSHVSTPSSVRGTAPDQN